MENDTIQEQMQKKGRHRKKQLYNSIMQQMEFYFSDSNLSKDKFLLPLIKKDPFVDVMIFMKFNKIRKLTSNVNDIIKAINNSEFLELSENETQVRRRTALKVKDNADNCTLYVERIKVDATHEWLSSLFSEFGSVTYVSIPKYKHNKVNKGFAFVEFEKECDAAEALNYFESIDCKMSLLIPPENLCSILTFEGTNINEADDNNKGDELCNDNLEKKRKYSPENIEISNKKLKTNGTKSEIETIDDNLQNDCDERKKKKHKKMKKKIFKELGLQVLSKTEWKKIRNRYLDNQKTKMKQLKQFLHKSKYSNYPEVKQKIDDKKNVEQEKLEKLTFTPGVIVKIQLGEPYRELKKIKEELQQYSFEIKYIDIPTVSTENEAYLRFLDNESAKKFCSSEYNGPSMILKGEEEEEYWNKINSSRSLKFKKNQKRLRGREKLLKKAEKELGKHIKFDETDS